ncbi:plastocyanin/azurin family copper-binding protein [Haladaptatus salinisoli]|uniref:plastocyanin/azurin family copper-binding protein n=1 Tax=Haladaptatus salinisoli TaxID=2884876 RepID=UPI001D0B78A0|nr:plastocyanin/azurin family copper-binding protein [Haladaptatus salinisoli]
MSNDRTLGRRHFLSLNGSVLFAFTASYASAQTNEKPENTTSASTITTANHHGEQSGHGSETDGHGHNGALDGPSNHADVKMTTMNNGSHFEPHIVWVNKGGTVTWHLESGSHSTTAYHSSNNKPQRMPDGAAGWDSGILSKSGETFKQTFKTAGIYDYFCIPHETTGMLGSVIVGNPPTNRQAGLKPPQKNLPSKAQLKIKSLNEKASKALGDGH